MTNQDPYPAIRQACQETHHCHPFTKKLEQCNTRLADGQGKLEETCVEEFFDLMECVDHCAAPKLFKELK